MNVQAALKDQYHASLSMLKPAIEQCPVDLWTGGTIAFWRVAYHTLFFTHLYLQPNVQSFRPWEHHRDEHQFLGPLPEPPAEYWRALYEAAGHGILAAVRRHG